MANPTLDEKAKWFDRVAMTYCKIAIVAVCLFVFVASFIAWLITNNWQPAVPGGIAGITILPLLRHFFPNKEIK